MQLLKPDSPSTMEVIDHNGIDVRGRNAVLKAHEALPGPRMNMV